MAPKLAVGIDIGGTYVKVGVVSGDRVLKPVKRPTPQSFGGCVETVASLVSQACGGETPEFAGVGVPGVIDPESRVVLDAPNLPWMEQEPLEAAIQERTGARVIVENDASAAAYGEARHGAGRGYPDFLLVTLGTGIGGGLVLGGQLFRGPGGMAGEFGHLPVGHERLCACGARGCLEAAVSAQGLLQNARESGVPVTDLPELAERARQNQEEARRVFQNAGVMLGEALAQVALLLDLRVFLIGGGGAPVLDLLKPPALGTLAMRAFGRKATDFTLERTRLGNDAGIIGAAELAMASADATASRA